MHKPTKPGFFWVRMESGREACVVEVIERKMSCDAGKRIVTYLVAEMSGSEDEVLLNDIDAGPGFDGSILQLISQATDRPDEHRPPLGHRHEDDFKSGVEGWEWLCETTLPLSLAAPKLLAALQETYPFWATGVGPITELIRATDNVMKTETK
jgi:hypothetical protein